METTVYLVLEKDKRKWQSLRLPKISTNRPHLAPTQIAIKLKIKLPNNAFEKTIPVATLQVEDQDLIVPEVIITQDEKE